MSFALRGISSLARQSRVALRPSTSSLLAKQVFFSQHQTTSHFALRFLSTTRNEQNMRTKGNSSGRDTIGGSIDKSRKTYRFFSHNIKGNFIKLVGTTGALFLAGAYYCNNHPEVALCDQMQQLVLGGKKK